MYLGLFSSQPCKSQLEVMKPNKFCKCSSLYCSILALAAFLLFTVYEALPSLVTAHAKAKLSATTY